ncbi:MAG: hypothetical protein LKJ98_06520 [Olsenella sp.]|jgi:hypothetical protein|nr:hypothetical protein [Olsenella sp.]
MATLFIFAKRSEEEIEMFGGEVYADIDGRNVAVIGTENVSVDVEPGKHLVKMYKSHDYGSMIGFAEAEIEAKEGESLVFRYAPPMMVSQPGHITVSDFKSYEQISEDVSRSGVQITKDREEAKKREEEAEKEKNKNNFWIILLVFIIPAIIWFFYYTTMMNAIYRY